MKTLASCDPVEFMVQTNKIRKAAEKWLTLTKIRDIRRRIPKVKPNADAENRRALREQVEKNISAIFDVVLEDHPQETAELLGLMCFIEPEDLKNHTMTELFGAFNELMRSPEVLDFFTSLMQLGKKHISTTARA